MKHDRRLFLALMLSGAILSIVIPALALCQSKAMKVDELSARAEVVAVGRVAGTKSGWENNKANIVTYVTLTVGEYLKGGGGGTMTIATPGGEVDGVGELYSHSARFAKDEQVVVFAEKDKQGRFRVSGGHEGKFTVSKDEASGIPLVSNSKRLEDFKTEIRNSLKAQPKKP
jgi:hypothetical protein